MNYKLSKALSCDVDVIRRITETTYRLTYNSILKPELIRYMLATWYNKDELSGKSRTAALTSYYWTREENP